MLLPKKKIYKDQANYKRYAQNSSFCEVCGSLAQDVHHIIGKGSGGANRDDRDSNLIALCRNHHNFAHGVDAKEWRERFFKIKGAK